MRLGLVGQPIAESLSPLLHEAALRRRGLSGGYSLFEVEAGGLGAVLEALRAGELDGLNVTVPYKVEVARMIDRCDALASQVGAVNTIVRDGHALVGWNTDLPGLVRAVREAWPEARLDAPALVIGAGGAAPAAVLAARALGCSEVRLWNRTAEKADELVSRLGVGRAMSSSEEAAKDVGLLIQASSHGMDLAGARFDLATVWAAGVLEHTPDDARIVDLVYRPRPTAWVRAAEALGREAIDGLGMLVHQAALAFELWTGARAAVDASSVAAPDLVAAMRDQLATRASRAATAT